MARSWGVIALILGRGRYRRNAKGEKKLAGGSFEITNKTPFPFDTFRVLAKGRGKIHAHTHTHIHTHTHTNTQTLT